MAERKHGNDRRTTLARLDPHPDNIREIQQWNSEECLWAEMKRWRLFRIFGTFGALIGFIFTIVALTNKHWLNAVGHSLGIWDTCYKKGTTETITTCNDGKPYWQWAVIVFMIFSAIFAFIGLILATCGMFRSRIKNMLYYYHSAGEAFIASAFVYVSALTIYAISTHKDKEISGYSYGYAYVLACTAALMFIIAWLSMCIDEILQFMSERCCCRNEQQTPS